MKQTRHASEQVINKLREAETMLIPITVDSQASLRRCSRMQRPIAALRASYLRRPAVAQVLQHLGVREATFNRWRNQFGSIKSREDPTRARRLDIAILREANDYLGRPQAPRGGGRS